MEPSDNSLQQALVDLYLNVKVRSTDEIEKYDEEKLEEERKTLKETEPLLLVEYIRTSIEILMNVRAEEKALVKSQKEETESVTSETPSQSEPPRAYEQQIQKLEEESRMHIRVRMLCPIRLVGAAAKTAHRRHAGPGRGDRPSSRRTRGHKQGTSPAITSTSARNYPQPIPSWRSR